MKNNIRIIGVTISLSWIGFLAMILFGKAISIIFADFFEERAVLIAFITGAVLLLLIVTGSVAVGSMVANSERKL